MSSLVGQTIGKYELVELLGSGGMAQVYRAIQLPLERSVAVKVLHSHLAAQEEFRTRFLREAKAVASLQDPHIVQIYDYEYRDGICYMAMEFLDGRSLEDRLKGADQAGQPGPLPLPDALQIIIQVAEALDFAHRHGVVHRDVKPANIMQTGDGRIILADFGIATILHETRLTVEGGTSGTPTYMSPEQALGERGDERSDIYSLGAVLYQLVTGQPPFEADTVYGLIMKHVNEPLPPASQINPDLPPAVEQIIGQTMAKSPADRYQAACDLAADLQAVLEGRSVSLASRPGLPPLKKRLVEHRNKFGWLGLAAALLLVLILARVIGTQPAASIQADPADGTAAETLPPNPADPDTVVSMAASSPSGQLLTENFDDNGLGWIISEGAISRQIVDGAYQVTVQTPDRAVAAYPENGYNYSDFIYQATGILVEGQPESGFGLVFRRQDNQNYYVFAVNGMQQWSVWRLEDGIWNELRDLPDSQTWTDSEAVRPAGEPNRLKVQMEGHHMRLFVNEEPLIETGDIDDDSFTSGGIGFYVASSRTAGNPLARVQFDTLVLTSLTDDSGVPSMTTDDE